MLFAASFAVSAFALGTATIECTWKNSNSKNAPLVLAKIENGRTIPVSSYTVGADKKAFFTFPVEKEGFFVLGTELQKPENKYIFYFKPGDKLNVDVEKNTYTLVGKNNSKENIEMAKWHDLMSPLEFKAYRLQSERVGTYKDFFPLLETKIAEAESFKAKKTKNAKFDEIFPIFREFNLMDVAVFYLYTMRSEHPSTADYIDYYKNLDVQKLGATDIALNYPRGIDILINAQYTKRRFDPRGVSAPEAVMLSDDPELIANPTIKGEIVMMFAGNRRTLENLEDYEKQYGQFIVTDAQKARMERMKEGLLREKLNREPAIDFTFPDIDGKNVSLSDFKGKVVFLDFWATWCGPCIASIPEIKKLEAEYHGKDIVFIAVSVDKAKDFEKWKTFVKEKELVGVQLFSSNDPKLSEDYKISGIPRFVVIDKAGNVAASRAMHPSTKEIREFLNAELAR